MAVFPGIRVAHVGRKTNEKKVNSLKNTYIFLRVLDPYMQPNAFDHNFPHISLFKRQIRNIFSSIKISISTQQLNKPLWKNSRRHEFGGKILDTSGLHRVYLPSIRLNVIFIWRYLN